MRLNSQGCARAAVVGLALLAVTTCSTLPHFSREVYTARVTDKQVKRKDKDDKYLVFTKLNDGSVRVFENTDSLLEFKWNSSDVQGQLEVGKNYNISAYGWRIPFFSCYENITEVAEVKK